MRIAFVAKKGGQGKTTFATNFAGKLAAQGRDVLLVDCEKEGGSALWQAIRTKSRLTPEVTFMQLFGGTVHEQLKRYESKFDDIIIDTPGLDSDELRSGLLAAEIMVSPVDISILSSAKLGALHAVIQQTKIYNPLLRCVLVPNRVHTHSTRGKSQLIRLQKVISELPDFTVTDAYLSNRAEVADIIEYGRTIDEGRDQAAKAEMQQIFSEVVRNV